MSVAYAKILLSNNERTKVEHSLKFVTEFDETHPTAQRFLQLSENDQILMLESMLKDLLVDAIQPVIDHINEGGSYAILKVAN
jgi:NurA-like 5'-3' nuclease